MNKNETAAPSVNLSPLMGLMFLTLLGVVVGLVMLYGLHNKIQKAPMTESIITADEIGQIELVDGMVHINLMERTDTGGIEKSQQISLPLEKFASGYGRLDSFMEQMIEKGIITQGE